MLLRSLIRTNLRLFQCSRTGIVCEKHLSKVILKENKAVIIHDESNEIISVSLRYINDELSVNKLFNFNRKSNEKSSVALTRISEKISFYVNKKRTKRFPDLSEIQIAVNLVSTLNKSLNDLDSIPCAESFINTSNFLKIDNTEYVLEVNPPVIKSLELPKKCILAGFMIYPSKLEGFNYNVHESHFTWFCSKEKFDSIENAKSKILGKSQWMKIGEGYQIFTMEKDESKLLKVVGTPVRGELVGTSCEAVANVLISSRNEVYPFEKRQTFTSSILDQNFLRVVSYNLLADFYADSNFSRSTLFPTCPPWALDISYRKQLFMKEILGYNADVICLQEVDKKVFFNDLKPIFSYYDLEGTYNSKLGLTAEGLAIFYRKEKLRLTEEKYYMLSQEIESNPIFEDLFGKLKQNEALVEVFAKQKVILQVSLLERKCSPSEMLLVGTTHLYSAPDSDHIRLLQAWMCVRLLKQEVERLKLENPEIEVSVLLCGDFNSHPEDAAYRLITSRHIGEEDSAWSSKPEQELKDLHLSHDMPFESACGTPEYTNYTVGFKGCLDYIFYGSDKFSVEQAVPFPTHEEVTEHEALPSLTFPSDHIALVADLRWREK